MNTQTIRAPLETGGRLPDLALPATPAGAPVSFRTPTRDNTVVLFLHAPDCQPCLAYVERLAGAHEQLRDWDGRILAVVPATLAEAGEIRERHHLPFPVLADPEGMAAARCGVTGGAILVADQWGELFLVQPGAPDEHTYPDADELAEWLRFVAIQCPECQGEAL